MHRPIAPSSAALALLLALPAAAQHAGQHGGHHHAPMHAAPVAQPYAGMVGRRIKALSAEDVDGLLTGRGLALARAAELNGYPGPMHVLEHADALGLTGEQRAVAEGPIEGDWPYLWLDATYVKVARPGGSSLSR